MTVDAAPADTLDEPADDYPSLGLASYSVGLLFVAYVFSFLDRQIVSLLVGPIREQFGITDFQYSLLAGAAFALLYTVAGLPLVIGGFLIDYFTRIGPMQLPLVGTIQPWQATMMTVGLPGLIVALLALTITEPTRKGMAKTRSGDDHVPVGTVARFLWQRKRVYLTLFLGSSMLAMAGYGGGAWYPEFLVRNYGMSKTAAGSSIGTILLTAGTLGIMIGPWVANKLADRGYTDYYVRAILITSLLTLVPSIAAPLAGSASLTLLLLWPATVLNSAYLGVMAASFQPITPNQMRGTTTAIYIFVTSIIGLAAGARGAAGNPRGLSLERHGSICGAPCA